MNHPFEYKNKEKGIRKQNLPGPPVYWANLSLTGFIILIVKWKLGGQIYFPFLNSIMSLKEI